VAVAATAAVADPGIAPNPSLAKPGMGVFWVGPLPFDLYPISDRGFRLVAACCASAAFLAFSSSSSRCLS
jgi:hypothetical protein